MPSVFTDEAGSADLAITTAADWSVNAAALPNGDPAVNGDGSIAPTYYPFGTALDFRSGSWTVEAWVRSTTATPGANQLILAYGSSVANSTRWYFYLNTSGRFVFGLLTTSDAESQIRKSGLISANTWYHVVCIIVSGGVPDIYMNNSLNNDTSTTTGTPQAPTATDRLFFGTNCVGDGDIGTATRVAKLAIYDRALTTGEINDHYLAMTAA